MNRPSPLQEILEDALSEKGVRLWVKRDDLLHPEISGNKWRKLKYNLLEARRLGYKILLTFGGAYSNHIAAVAAAGKEFGFATIGIIRGGQILPRNPTLSFAEHCGMRLQFITRTTYRKKDQPGFLESLKTRFGDFYLLPEGGTNALALRGCAEIIDELESQTDLLPDYICVCCGTGGTAAGLVAGLNGRQHMMGFSVLKGSFLKTEVASFLENYGVTFQNWSVETSYHFGGYAKFRPELIDFINDFRQKFDIPLDPIYTGKMFFGIFDMIKKGRFQKGTTLLAIHTGGLQGIEGFNARFGNLIVTHKSNS